MPDHRRFACAIALYFPFLVAVSVLILGGLKTLTFLAIFAYAFLARNSDSHPQRGWGVGG